MTKQQALYSFFSSFGIKAYKNTAVPDDVVYPYLTYEETITNFQDSDVNCTVNLWYYTDAETEPNRKADEIGERLGLGGTRVRFDGGWAWIKKGSPFCQSVAVENTAVKCRYINLSITWFNL